MSAARMVPGEGEGGRERDLHRNWSRFVPSLLVSVAAIVEGRGCVALLFCNFESVHASPRLLCSKKQTIITYFFPFLEGRDVNYQYDRPGSDALVDDLSVDKSLTTEM